MRQAGGRSVSVWLAAGVLAVGLAVAAGCSSQKKLAQCAETPPGCPKPIVTFAPVVSSQMLDTPSTAYIAEANAQTALVQRNWPTMAGYYAPQVVQHTPLYFEDPFESVEDISGRCPEGWTCADLFAIPYNDARWMLNTIALPVSAVVNPPCQRMCSDGVPSRKLEGKVDASPCPQPVPVPFDLMCPEQQAVDIAAADRAYPAADAPAFGPTTRPAQ